MDIATVAYQGALDEAMPYLTGRGIDRATAERFRLGVVRDPISGHEHVTGRLSIPSISSTGAVYSLRFRTLTDGEPKYIGTPGEMRLFNLRAITEAGSVICITEGEMDAITLDQCGYHAVGVPGANAWKRPHSRIFAGFSRVYVFGDGDASGRDFARRVSDSMRQAIIVPVPDGCDVNSVFMTGAQTSISNMLERVK